MKGPHQPHMLRLFLFMLVLLLISGCSNTTTPTPKLPIVKPVIKTTILQITATQIPDLSVEIENNTPTPEPLNPYIFTAMNGKQIDLSYGHITIDFDEGAFSGKVVSTTLASPQNLGIYISTSEALTVGNGVGLIRPDNYGNLLISLHSGYHHSKPLEAEALRKYLEHWGLSGADYVKNKLTEIAGSKGTLFTSDGSVKVEIVGGVRLQPKEAEELSANPEKVLDLVIRKDTNGYLAIGNPEIFEDLKTDGHEILITFCGWGPNKEPTYYGYVILLNVMEQP